MGYLFLLGGKLFLVGNELFYAAPYKGEIDCRRFKAPIQKKCQPWLAPVPIPS